MKSKGFFFVFVGILFLFSCSTSKKVSLNENEIIQKVQKKDFTIFVNYAYPSRGSQIYLTSKYSLKIKNDSAFAYLPYYGVAYVAPYNSSEGGIKFSEPMYDYVQTVNKKNDGWKIRFKVKTVMSDVNVFMEIFKNGISSININSYERESIHFSGEVKLNE